MVGCAETSHQFAEIRSVTRMCLAINITPFERSVAPIIPAVVAFQYSHGSRSSISLSFYSISAAEFRSFQRLSQMRVFQTRCSGLVPIEETIEIFSSVASADSSSS